MLQISWYLLSDTLLLKKDLRKLQITSNITTTNIK